MFILSWMIAKTGALVLLPFTVLIVLAFAFGQFAPPQPQLYFIAYQGNQTRLVALDVDRNLFTRFRPRPSPTVRVRGQWAGSPDGKHFVVESGFDLVIMDADGGNRRWLTQDQIRDYDPAWSPDGARIAFVSERGGSSDIYVMDADGGNVQPLTADTAQDITPTWSPDGQHIAFASNRDGATSIYVMDANGDNQHLLVSSGGRDSAPMWSPDGGHILFWAEMGKTTLIYVVNADGSHLRPLSLYDRVLLNPLWLTH
jgi:tol-pal system beta propeller repeat protein TolB